MATFGSFADLTPAQVELAQRRQANTDPLSALIQGFQMPQQLANQALMSQVKTALAQQQLQDIQNPEEALARRVREAIAINQAKPIEVDKSLLQYNPSTKRYESVYTSPTTVKSQPLEFRNIGNAWVGLHPVTGATMSTTPIVEGAIYKPSPAGLFKVTKDEKGKEIETLVPGSGPIAEGAGSTQAIYDPNDPTKIIGYTVPKNFKSVNDLTGKGGAGGGGFEPGVAARDNYLGYIEINRELNQTKNFADEIKKTGKFPSSGQVALNQFLAARPEDIPGAGLIPGIDTIYAAFQNKLGEAQTPESKELEARRAYIASTLIRLQAGLAQTNAEFRNIGPTTPKSTDTYEQLVGKLDILTKRNLDKIEDYQTFYPGLRGMTFRGLGDAPAPVEDVIERQPGESSEDFFIRKYGK